MKKYLKIGIADTPKEDSRVGSFYQPLHLSQEEHAMNAHFQDITRGYLKAGGMYDWHMHRGMDEVCIIIRGVGKFFWEQEEEDYTEGDIFIIPADTMHRFITESKLDSEFYFIRIKI